MWRLALDSLDPCCTG